MKIFILNPNFNEEKKSIMNVRARQPLSLAIIASILRNDGYQIKLLDANVLNFSFQQVLKSIKEYEPDILLLTSSPIDRWECPNSHIDNIFNIINQAPARFKVLTGSHGTTMPEWVFANCRVDFIIRSEPETAVKNLVAALKDGRPIDKIVGLSWRQNGAIVNNSAERILNLDSLPFPAYDLLPMAEYGMGGLSKPFTILMTSRGCPFNCIFCLKAMLPDKYVERSVPKVIEEIEHLIKNYGIKSIFFQDWEFFINEHKVKEICDQLIERKLAISWAANARATDIIRAKDLMPLVRKAGCVKINIGLESASDKVLKEINKQITSKDLQKAIDILKENNIVGGYYMLINAPGENRETIRETMDFIAKNNLDVKPFLFPIPYPGTILFEKLKQKYPHQKFDWSNIEKYAGSVDTQFSPFWSLWYLRNYKNQLKFGKLYLFSWSFWHDLFFRATNRRSD